ncbi:glutamine--fructose-6-phosphate aminotransferase, partial [Candidatus Bathyarchaeota archaeon]
MVLEGLKRLEYRGYDSCGQATVHGERLFVKKGVGEIDKVHAELRLDDLPGEIGIGHTRWATHGAPTKENAHPHTDCRGQIAVVHNGIIENFLELRKELEAKGHVFKSKTDTEMVPHLIEEFMRKGLGFVEAVIEAVKKLKGSFALAIIHTGFEGMVCVKMESPLVLGVGRDGIYVASDIPAFLPYTNVVVQLEDGDVAIIRPGGYEVLNFLTGKKVRRKPRVVDWTADMAQKEGYPHFMLKEIHEQPKCLRNTLRLDRRYLTMMADLLCSAQEAFMVACGTSYHACLAASYAISKLAKKAVHPVIASEFIENYGSFVGPRSVLLAVSQSGETADTLEAVEHARA